MTVLKQYVGGVWTPILVGEQGPAGLTASTTEPASPYTGQLWYETDTDRLYRYTGSAFKLFGGALPRWDLHSASTWSVATSDEVALDWDFEDADADLYHASSSAIVQIPTGLGGLYLVSYYISSPSLGGDFTFQCWVDVNTANGSAPANDTGRRYAQSAWSAPSTSIFSASDIVMLSAGDNVRVKMFQNTGGTITAGYANRKDLNAFRGVLLYGV